MGLNQEILGHSIKTCKICNNVNYTKTNTGILSRFFNKVIGENNTKTPKKQEQYNKPKGKNLVSSSPLNNQINNKIKSGLKAATLTSPHKVNGLMNNYLLGTSDEIISNIKNKENPSNPPMILLPLKEVVSQINSNRENSNSLALDLTNLKKHNELLIEAYEEGEENIESSRMNSRIYSSNQELELSPKDKKIPKYKNKINTLATTEMRKLNDLSLPKLKESNLPSKKSLRTVHSPQRKQTENTLNASRYVFNKQKGIHKTEAQFNKSRTVSAQNKNKYNESLQDTVQELQSSLIYDSASSTNIIQMAENTSGNETSINLPYQRLISNELTKTSDNMFTQHGGSYNSPLITGSPSYSSSQNYPSPHSTIGTLNKMDNYNFNKVHHNMKVEVTSKSETIKQQLDNSNNTHKIRMNDIIGNNHETSNISSSNGKSTSKDKYDFMMSNTYDLGSNNNMRLSSAAGFLEDEIQNNQSSPFFNLTVQPPRHTHHVKSQKQNKAENSDILMNSECYSPRNVVSSSANKLIKLQHNQHNVKSPIPLSNSTKLSSNSSNYLQNIEDCYKVGSSSSSLLSSLSHDKYLQNDVSKIKRAKNSNSSDNNINTILSPLKIPFVSNHNVTEIDKINVLISKNLENINNYYSKNGILQPFKLKINEIKWFYKLLEGGKFTYYITDYIKDIDKDVFKESSKSIKFDISSHNLSKRIIVVTPDFLIVIGYEEQIVEYLKLMQRGLDTERLIMLIREDSIKSRESNMGSTMTKNTKQSVEYYDDESGGKVSVGNNNLNSGLISCDETIKSQVRAEEKMNITIKSLFPLKLLLRITSKKYNPNYLSFYFKLPNLESGSLSNEYYKILNLINSNTFENFNKFTKDANFFKILKKINDSKEANV